MKQSNSEDVSYFVLSSLIRILESKESTLH